MARILQILSPALAVATTAATSATAVRLRSDASAPANWEGALFDGAQPRRAMMDFLSVEDAGKVSKLSKKMSKGDRYQIDKYIADRAEKDYRNHGEFLANRRSWLMKAVCNRHKPLGNEMSDKDLGAVRGALSREEHAMKVKTNNVRMCALKSYQALLLEKGFATVAERSSLFEQEYEIAKLEGHFICGLSTLFERHRAFRDDFDSRHPRIGENTYAIVPKQAAAAPPACEKLNAVAVSARVDTLLRFMRSERKNTLPWPVPEELREELSKRDHSAGTSYKRYA